MIIEGAFYQSADIYLQSHSVGLLPKVSQAHAQQFFQEWQTMAGEAWPQWLSAIDAFGAALAQLLNSDADAFCPQTNLSAALSKILYALPERKGRRKILLSTLDFPSMGFVLQQATRAGYEIEYVPSVAPEETLSVWERHLTEDVQLALMTHVFSENNQQNPIAQMTQLAKQKEVFTVVDIAQSVGVIPIDLQMWHADFVLGCSIKWLCGGPGAAFLWGNPKEIHQFFPRDVGWFSHETPFEFDIRHFEYAKTARRFLGGTPSILPLYIASASIALLNQIGMQSIYYHNQQCVAQLIAGAQNIGLKLASPIDKTHRGGTVVISFDSPEQVVDHLKAQRIIVDWRPKFGVRFSPHLYTTATEIERVIAVLAER